MKPRLPSHREVVLTKIRVAGYHEDHAAYTRLLIEERVSKAVADEQFRNGRAQRASGVRCDCYECKNG
jgi:hypothetical protein